MKGDEVVSYMCGHAKNATTPVRPHTIQPAATRAADRHPGGEILSRYDWLIDTISYFDWLVFYEAGKFARPIRLPPPGWAGALDWWKIKIHGFDWLS